MYILGIDPGSRITAYGIVDVENNDFSYTYLKLKSKRSLEDKIYDIFKFTIDIIDNSKIDSVAIENPFYSVNIKSSMILSQIKGAIIAAVKMRGLDIYQYSPREIKKSVCGYGAAEKEQVRFIVEKTLHIDLKKEPLDVSDALSVALTHSYTKKF